MKHVVDAVRVIAGTPDELYRAWTEPELMRKWMARTVEADVRVGGRYRMEVDQPDGAVHVFTGEYLELEPPHRLVMTFRVDGPAIEEEINDEKVTVLLEPASEGGTTVTIRNTWTGKPYDDAAYEELREGWGLWLDLLAKLF